MELRNSGRESKRGRVTDYFAISASFPKVLRYFEWVPFDPRGIRGER
jgi:hypothetical protein